MSICHNSFCICRHSLSVCFTLCSICFNSCSICLNSFCISFHSLSPSSTSCSICFNSFSNCFNSLPICFNSFISCHILAFKPLYCYSFNYKCKYRSTIKPHLQCYPSFFEGIPSFCICIPLCHVLALCVQRSAFCHVFS